MFNRRSFMATLAGLFGAGAVSAVAPLDLIQPVKEISPPKTWDTIFTKSPLITRRIDKGPATLLVLNKRLAEAWPAFTGFKESPTTIDLVGQVWPSGKRLVGRYVNVRIDDTEELLKLDESSAFWLAHHKIQGAVMAEVLKDPQYVALPQDDWNDVWNGLLPAHRILDRESPLGVNGYVSILDPRHGVLVIVAKNHPSLSPGLDDDVCELGLDVKLELPGGLHAS